MFCRTRADARYLYPVFLSLLVGCGATFDTTQNTASKSSSGRTNQTGQNGQNTNPGQQPVTRPPSNSNILPAASRFTCDKNQSKAILKPGRALTKVELGNTVRDLFGPEVFAVIKVSFDGIPEDDESLNGSSEYTEVHAASLMRLAYQLAGHLSQNLQSLTNRGFANPCLLEAAPTQTCKTEFAKTLALKVMRRPADSEELASLAQLLNKTDFKTSVRDTLFKVLMNPEFLFHLYLGTTNGTSIAQTNYEIASQISYALLHSMPDAELFADAANSRLQDPAVIRGHIMRLLGTTVGQNSLIKFFDHWLHIAQTPEVSEDPAFLKGMDGEGLKDELVAETRAYIKHIVFEKQGTFEDLISSKVVLPRSARVAELYESAVWKPGEAPPTTSSAWRTGLLMRAPLMISGDTGTSPILRGTFLRRQFLCDPLLDPPSDVFDSASPDHLDPLTSSTRQRITSMTSGPTCKGCHASINPLGFALENIDGLGRWRTREEVIVEGKVVKEWPVDARVSDLYVDEKGLTSVQDAKDLLQVFQNSTKPSACFSRQIFRYVRTRLENLKDNGDSCALSQMHELMLGGQGRILDVFAAALSAEILKSKQL